MKSDDRARGSDEGGSMIPLARFAALLLAHQPMFGFTSSSFGSQVLGGAAARTASAKMAVDMKDPKVAEMMMELDSSSPKEMKEELEDLGIFPTPGQQEDQLKMMLIEARLMMSGGSASSGSAKPEQKRPSKFKCKFDEYMWDKPAFKEYFNDYDEDVQMQNVIGEYANDPEKARLNYAKSERLMKVMDIVQEKIDAKVVAQATSPKISFKGFPSMGEEAMRSTMAAFGEIKEFSCEEYDGEFTPEYKGVCEFQDSESAQKAIEKWNGVDMGMGTTLIVAPM